MEIELQKAVEQRAAYNAALRERYAELLRGPHARQVERVLHDIAPYVGLSVGATSTDLLAADILVLLQIIDRAQQ